MPLCWAGDSSSCDGTMGYPKSLPIGQQKLMPSSKVCSSNSKEVCFIHLNEKETCDMCDSVIIPCIYTYIYI